MSTPHARITVPADSSYAHVLGLVTDGVATHLDTDRIDDLDLAIEEVTETLAQLDGAGAITLEVHDGEASLRCEFLVDGPERVASIDMDDLRTTVLDAVTDGIQIDTEPPRVTLLIHTSH